MIDRTAPRGLLLQALNTSYRASLRPAWRRFVRATRDPAAAQARRLEAILAGARGTAFARAHGLERVRTLSDLQAAVPIRDYDGLWPWIERAVAGEPAVLTRQEPRVFERSSGSTRAAKLVPYPQALLDEFSAATGPWLYDLLRDRRLRRRSAYWSISPAGALDERTPGGVRVGFQDDTEYFPRPVRRLLGLLLPVPAAVARLATVEDCRYASLLHLVADPRLGFVSVWSPSFFTLLVEQAVREADRLARDLARGALSLPGGGPPPAGLAPPPADPARATRLRAALAADPPDLAAVWPRLRLVSCWADGAARRLLPGLRRLLPPGVLLQPKGLLATEGVVSFPLRGHPGAALAVSAHVLELQPSDDPAARPLAPHEAEPGGRYAPILTTGGGLYRYRLGDEVEVVGRLARTPLVRFTGRLDGVSDLAGEKLSPGFVGEALDAATAGLAPAFALVAPRADGPGYALYLEADAGPAAWAAAAAALEAALRRQPHYDYCRRLGQLEPVVARPVRDGAARYEAALVARGRKAGEIKPPGLHAGAFWGEVFGDRERAEPGRP